jgi:two-component system C4-dicarboxylate transport response regulator DctD
MADMRMPIMDGYELFYELKKLNPELPIIVSSGYGDVEVSSGIDMDIIAGLISKPYGLDPLRKVFKNALEGLQ